MKKAVGNVLRHIFVVIAAASVVVVVVVVEAIVLIGRNSSHFICPTYLNKTKKDDQAWKAARATRFYSAERSLSLFWMLSSALKSEMKMNRGKQLSRKCSLL